LILQVNRRKKITIKPLPPKFPVSPRITVTIGQAQHTVVYGPYFSCQHEHSLFPYAHAAGQTFHNQNYGFYLASNSRIMNPLHRPKITDDGGTRVDYFSKQKVSQKPASAIMQKLLATMCGDDLGDGAPELYGELEDLLKANRVCNFALYVYTPPLQPPAYSPPSSPPPDSPSQAMFLACICLPDFFLVRMDPRPAPPSCH